MLKLFTYDIMIQINHISQLKWIIWLDQYAYVWADPQNSATKKYKIFQCFHTDKHWKVAKLFFSFLFFQSMHIDLNLVFWTIDTYSRYDQ